MGCESFDVVRFDLGPLHQGQTGMAHLKSPNNSFIIGPRGLQCKPTYRKSWAANRLMWSDLILGPLRQTRIAKLKVLITRLQLVLEGCNVKPAYRKLWAANLLMWSDLTLGPSFKVKRG